MSKILEKDIQKQILEYLTYKRIFHFRNNTGGAVYNTKGKQSFVRFGTPGSPDIICVIRGRFVGIEVKGPAGIQSPTQKQFQVNLEEVGGVYILAHSLDDVETKLYELYGVNN